MPIYSDRPTNILALPLDDGVEVLHPQNVVLDLVTEPASSLLDLGAFCYLERENRSLGRHSIRRFGGIRVLLSSYRPSRSAAMRRVITTVSDDLRMGRRSARTVHGALSALSRMINWCDANEHANFLDEIRFGRAALEAYTEALRSDVVMGLLSPNSAALYQNSAREFLSIILDDPHIHSGLRLLRYEQSAATATSPPDEINQGLTLGLCADIFEQYSAFVLRNSEYPFLFASPRIDQVDALWVFPTNNKFSSPYDKANPEFLHNCNAAYDYERGRVLTVAEFRQAMPNRLDFKAAVEMANERLREANEEKQHHQRRRLALSAHHAFVVMFLANTGMNWAQVRSLKWSEKYEVTPDGQGFRAIKYRAGGKVVTFRIETGFMPKFERFLELRSYLLNGQTFDGLFVQFGVNLQSNPAPIELTSLKTVYKITCRLNPGAKPITSRQWRAAKADWLLRTSDLSTAATILQNSERTVLKHYAAGSEHTAASELSEYFVRLNAVIVPDQQVIPSASSVGGCMKHGHPESTSTTVIQPDCRQPEGCLFCNHYAIHADEADVRKLLSCRHCIHETEHLSETHEQFLRLFGPVIGRIDAILAYVEASSEKHAELVGRVRREVTVDGKLDAYWERKMEMLVSLGVIKG